MHNEIFVNQAGYAVDAVKIAVLPFECEDFILQNEKGETVFSGKTRPFGLDEFSQDNVWQADFSCWKEPGTFRVVADGKKSAAFTIGENVYLPLMKDITRAFYYLRCGQELLPEHAGEYTHKACHRSLAREWENHDVEKEVFGGWHDAGDYGRYVTAAACALCHLLYAYVLYPEVLSGLEMNIPESGSGVPDILSECRYELEWIMKMQREDGGAYHKETTAQHAGFVMPEDDLGQLYLLPVSSMATADLAAICALAARVYRPFDAEFAGKLEKTAFRSYRWLLDNPDFLDFRNPEGCGTGGYYERDDYSNRFWAAAEMYALTGDKTYHEHMVNAMKRRFPLSQLGYGDVGGFGLLCYLLCDREKDAQLVERFRSAFRGDAQRFESLMNQCGYGAAMSGGDYIWGSNMVLMKHAMTFAIADWLDGENRYLPAVCRQMDYLMGVNPLGISYVTGNGEYRCNWPHLRPSSCDGIEECIPGMVCGGPNRRPADPDAQRLVPEGTAPMKCFADYDGCYSLNEITIYWNSPTVFALAYMMSKLK